MKILSKEELLALTLPEAVVEIPALGGAVRVRALTRKEFMHVYEQEGEGGYEQQDLVVAAGMLEPQMSVEEVTHLATVLPGLAITNVAMRIFELSGLSKDAAKEAYKSLRDES